MRKESKSVIHVTIRSSKTKSHTHRYHNTKSTATSKRTLTEASCTEIQRKQSWPDWTTFENHHEENATKKMNSKRKQLLWSIGGLILFILLAILTIVLTTVLFKPNKIHRDAILRWNKTGITVAGKTGQCSTATDKLCSPNGLAFDWEHSLYIAEMSSNRVQRFLRGASLGTTVCGQANGAPGANASQLNGARKLLVTSNKDIYVSDRINHRVQFWPFGSSLGTTVAGTGSQGVGNNQLNLPQSIFIDSSLNVLYIADTDNSRIMRYLANATSGDVVAGVIYCGMNNRYLCYPTGLYYDPMTNFIITCNYRLSNVVSWKIGDNQWTYVAGSISMTSGNSSAELNGPEGLAIDPMHNIYIADKLNHRIQFFPVGQSTGITIAGITGISGSNATLLTQPFELGLDNQLNLYVSDTNNHRVQKFLRY